jgi:hypothetical protein
VHANEESSSLIGEAISMGWLENVHALMVVTEYTTIKY